MSICFRIEKAIEAKKANKTELAKLLGVSRDTLYNWTDENIKFSVVLRLSEILGVPVSDFLQDQANKSIVSEPSASYGKKLTYKLIDIESMEVDPKKGIISIFLKK